MKNHRLMSLALIVCLLLLGTIALAVVPQAINYQGRLTDAEGDPVEDGLYELTFVIYDNAVGGTALWSGGTQSVQVTDGLFCVQIGAPPMPVLPHDLFSGDTARYLGLTLDETEIVNPRLKIVSAAYAYQALRADTADYAREAPTADVWDWSDSSSYGPDSVMYTDTSQFAFLAEYSQNAYRTDSADAIADGGVDFVDIGNNGAGDGQVIKWSGGAWTAGNDLDGGWYDGGGSIYVKNTGAKVGIGTDAPAEKLDVIGGTIFLPHLAPTSAGTSLRWYNGRLYFYPSSRKYKDDIEPLVEDFYKILLAEPKSFIDRTSGEQMIGYIAEDFDSLGLAHLVSYEDGNPQSIRYELISLYLLEIIKDQLQTIDKLKANNQSLSLRLTELDALAGQVSKMEDQIRSLLALRDMGADLTANDPRGGE